MKLKTEAIIPKIQGKTYVRFKNRYGSVTVPGAIVLALLKTADEVDIYIRRRTVQFLFSDVTTAIAIPGNAAKSSVTISLRRGRYAAKEKDTTGRD